jgi:hypothetical protein
MTGKIFVNYRRDDSAPHALSIAQYLEREFGARNVFIDIDRMRAGQNFHKVLEQRLADCSVVLTVIGPNWLDLRNDAGQRRIDDPEDWVRLEMARALARGITTIPVLVGGAELPKKTQLPDELKPLVQRHAAIITTNGFRNDMAGLVRDIRDIIGEPAVRKMVAGGLGIAAVALAFAGGAALFQYVSFNPAPSGLNVLQETNLQAAESAKAAEARRAADMAKADAEAKRAAAAAAEADAKAKAEHEARRQADAAAKAKREQAEAAARQKSEEEARAKAKEAERQRLAALQAEAKAAASQPLTDPTLLKEVRARLYALNFDPGPLEGSEPALTERAIREFEAQVRVAETGRPTSALLERLRAVPEPRPWGAIVYARTSEKWGMAWGQQTRKEAVASARSTCSERSAECAVEVSFFGSECAAFAHSTASWAITARNGIAEAKEAALADCKKRGEGCRIIASVCANGGERFGVK